MGFHIDGFACERVVAPARLVVPVPDGVSTRHAACAGVTFATVEHMLFDNARLRRGETILVHAGGSGIGTAAITLAKATGCSVIATVGDDAKGAKARALGADHVVNYRNERFEHVVRKLTAKRGVDVVFEHTGADTWNGSLLSLRRGGRLVTCGATSGPTATINLMQLFQQQYRIIGSFGASIRNVGDGLQKMAIGLNPTVEAEIPLENSGRASSACATETCSASSSSASPHEPSVRILALAQRAAREARELPRRRSPSPSSWWPAWFRSARSFAPADFSPARSGCAFPGDTRSACAIFRSRSRKRPNGKGANILGQSWDNMGRAAVEYFFIDQIWDFDPAAAKPGRIEAEGAERFVRLATDNKPAIILSAHLANWELPMVAAERLGLAPPPCSPSPGIAGSRAW